MENSYAQISRILISSHQQKFCHPVQCVHLFPLQKICNSEFEILTNFFFVERLWNMHTQIHTKCQHYFFFSIHVFRAFLRVSGINEYKSIYSHVCMYDMYILLHVRWESNSYFPSILKNYVFCISIYRNVIALNCNQFAIISGCNDVSSFFCVFKRKKKYLSSSNMYGKWDEWAECIP